jgi:uncharacterized protein DUF397
MMADLSTASWRKSSHSSTNGCVEVAFVRGQVAPRAVKLAVSGLPGVRRAGGAPELGWSQC